MYGCDEWELPGYSDVVHRSSYVAHFEIKSLGKIRMNRSFLKCRR